MDFGVARTSLVSLGEYKYFRGLSKGFVLLNLSNETVEIGLESVPKDYQRAQYDIDGKTLQFPIRLGSTEGKIILFNKP